MRGGWSGSSIEAGRSTPGFGAYGSEPDPPGAHPKSVLSPAPHTCYTDHIDILNVQGSMCFVVSVFVAVLSSEWKKPTWIRGSSITFRRFGPVLVASAALNSDGFRFRCPLTMHLGAGSLVQGWLSSCPGRPMGPNIYLKTRAQREQTPGCRGGRGREGRGRVGRRER